MKCITRAIKDYSKAELKDLITLIPSRDHVGEIMNEPTNVLVNNSLTVHYNYYPFDLSEIENVLPLLTFNKNQRMSGITTNTIGINASPRAPLFDNKCAEAQFRRDFPKQHEKFISLAQIMSKVYQENFKADFVNQVKNTYSGPTKVDPFYRIERTPFTSGVINKDSALSYHFDQANTSHGISCMVIFTKGIAGGELILPQLDIGFACQDHFMLLFDGKNYLHGVTPIIKQANRKGYRYTIVYYNNKGMKLCLPPADELLHYQHHIERQADKKVSKLEEA